MFISVISLSTLIFLKSCIERQEGADTQSDFFRWHMVYDLMLHQFLKMIILNCCSNPLAAVIGVSAACLKIDIMLGKKEEIKNSVL